MANSTSQGAERQYQDASGSYILPNDAQEHDRLDAQSEAIIGLMHGRPFHAPVQNPKRILDIGCGTGTMTYLLARKYPDAEVIGIDISAVPERHQQPKNLIYLQGNIMELAKSDDPRFAPGSADYIFHRLLFFGMTDWSGYVAAVGSLLKPGGWTEMQDYDINIKDSTGKSLSNEWTFYHYFIEDCAAIGLDVEAGRKLASYMQEAGLFGHISEKVYKVPIKRTPEIPEGDFMAELNEKWMGVSSQALMKRVCGGRRSAEEVEIFRADIAQRFTNTKPGDHCRLFVATAQREI